MAIASGNPTSGCNTTAPAITHSSALTTNAEVNATTGALSTGVLPERWANSMNSAMPSQVPNITAMVIMCTNLSARMTLSMATHVLLHGQAERGARPSDMMN